MTRTEALWASRRRSKKPEAALRSLLERPLSPASFAKPVDAADLAVQAPSSAMEAGTLQINLGCGADYRDGWVNVDMDDSHHKVDMVHDLEQAELPFADNSAVEIVLHHVLEHMVRPERLLSEIHRVLKHGGTLSIIVPHASHPNAWVDVTHRRPWPMESIEFAARQYGFHVMSLETVKEPFGAPIFPQWMPVVHRIHRRIERAVETHALLRCVKA